jgi:transposase
MSAIHITPFYQFCRVKVVQQTVDALKKIVFMTVQPDERYTPVCSKCKQQTKGVHSYNDRSVRDLNILEAKTVLSVAYRTLRCQSCGTVVEELPLLDPYKRVTRRLAVYILELCKYMTIKEVAGHLALDWKTVKQIHKRYLEKKFSEQPIGNPKVLVVDEISIRKRHNYLTLVVDWESGKVLWVGEGRKYETLKAFFDSLSEEQRTCIQAVAIDMWDPYIKAVKECCPEALIVFDQFHMVAAFNRVIDEVRNSEYRKATKAQKEVIKGNKYLLLKNKKNLREEDRPKLKYLLGLNEALTTAYILKDYLKNLWHYKYPRWVEKALAQWCSIAYESEIQPLKAFTRTLLNYSYGIINHCRYLIHTSRIKGINNKIKVIKRKAYGFHDIAYFSLIIKEAFSFCN